MAQAPVATASSDDLQQLAASLGSVRQSVDQLAIQFAFGQRQTADNIAKLQSDEREILQKLSALTGTCNRPVRAQTSCDVVRAITRGASAVK